MPLDRLSFRQNLEGGFAVCLSLPYVTSPWRRITENGPIGLTERGDRVITAAAAKKKRGARNVFWP